MLKKMVVGFFILGLAGFLIFGALYRTEAKLNGTKSNEKFTISEITGGNKGNNAGNSVSDRNVVGDEEINDDINEGANDLVDEPEVSSEDAEFAEKIENTENAESTNLQSGGGRGKNAGKKSSETDYTSQSIQDWQLMTGIVVTADDYTLEIDTDDEGGVIQAANAAWSYALSQGFQIDKGDAVEVRGFYDTDHIYEICCLTNLSTGQSVSVRDEAGHPLWAGKGGGNSHSGRRNM